MLSLVRRVFTEYFNLTRPNTILFNFTFCLFLAASSLGVAATVGTTSSDLIKKLNDLAVIIISSFSILAGFNATCLSILATSNSSIIIGLKKEIDPSTQRRKAEQLYAYFSGAVVIQLSFLLLSLLVYLALICAVPRVETTHSILLLNMVNAQHAAWLLAGYYLFAILFSINMTIINISILYSFLVADARSSN